MVEGIERVRAKLQVDFIAQRERLSQPKILVDVVRTPQVVAAANRKADWPGEGGYGVLRVT
jgi:hypothetical protein